jgi:hypothetical protein
MWFWLKPGGKIFWYDFIYNNSSNSDERGIPLKRVRELFPDGKIDLRRVTLAPLLAGESVKYILIFIIIFNIFSFSRTHVLCWIEKA